MNKSFLPIITAAAIGLAAVPAQAADNRAESAMAKGVRDYARFVVKDAKVSQVRLDAKSVADVGDRSTVTGSFRLTKNGRTAVYRLTAKARVLRLSPSALEYRLAAKATQSAAGLPKSTGAFSGFLQGPSAQEG
jgi:hypothetical protein